MIQPTLNNIFNRLEFADCLSPKMEYLQESFHEKLNKICPDFKDSDEIETSVNELLCESQFMGFLQGYELARSLFIGRPI